MNAKLFAAVALTSGMGMTAPALPQVRGDRVPDAAAPGPAPAEPSGPGSLKNAIELCDRLAGTERDICLKQAKENRERAQAAPGPQNPGPPAGVPGSDATRGKDVR
jgi:hypothetical protein